MKLTAKGMARVGEEDEVGVVILEPSSNDVLIGMAFLRLFEKALFVTQDTVLLVDESRKPDMDGEQVGDEPGPSYADELPEPSE
jgi:hypothetical protein